MSKYGMALIIQGREINIPVLPSKLKVTSPGKNDTTIVLELGEILLLRTKGLRTVSWDSFFPANSGPYVSGRITSPIEIVRNIQKTRDQKIPLRFLLTSTDLDINTQMGIDTFDYEERSGELGDLYYSLKLCEWREYAPRRIALSDDPEQPALTQEPQRSGEPQAAAAKTYTVVKGDCLWNIAKKFYGQGSDWPKIYQANKGIIGSNPNLIYPGQVYTIP